MQFPSTSCCWNSNSNNSAFASFRNSSIVEFDSNTNIQILEYDSKKTSGKNKLPPHSNSKTTSKPRLTSRYHIQNASKQDHTSIHPVGPNLRTPRRRHPLLRHQYRVSNQDYYQPTSIRRDESRTLRRRIHPRCVPYRRYREMVRFKDF